MGEYLGVLLLMYGPWFLVSAAIVTGSVFIGRALSRRNTSAVGLAALNERMLRLEEEHAEALAALAARNTAEEFERQLVNRPDRTHE